MKFCKHKFKITNQFGEKFCELCGRKKGDYIYQLELEITRLISDMEYRSEKFIDNLGEITVLGEGDE